MVRGEIGLSSKYLQLHLKCTLSAKMSLWMHFKVKRRRTLDFEGKSMPKLWIGHFITKCRFFSKSFNPYHSSLESLFQAKAKNSFEIGRELTLLKPVSVTTKRALALFWLTRLKENSVLDRERIKYSFKSRRNDCFEDQGHHFGWIF